MDKMVTLNDAELKIVYDDDNKIKRIAILIDDAKYKAFEKITRYKQTQSKRLNFFNVITEVMFKGR